jgi:hypothetical protein
MSVRRRTFRGGLALVSVVLAGSVSSVANGQEACFARLDNGVDMMGWRKSTTNPHGPGDGWTVEDGAFVGRQTAGQQGGILMTEASYRDVEVLFEVKVDWGCDSGFFFRTTEGARAYQVTIDHLDASGVGTIWGEGFSPELREIPYFLTDDGNAAILAPDRHEEPIFDLSQWSSLWDPTAFNEVRARVEGNPPRIQVWISETLVTDFTDGMTRSEVSTSGPLAIQVHSGSRWITNGTVAFKNIRVRDLTVPCDGAGGAGNGGNGGNSGSDGGGKGGGGGKAAGGQAMGGQGVGGGAGGGLGGSAGSSAGGKTAEAGAGAGGAAVGGGVTGGGSPAGGQLSGTGGAGSVNGGTSGAAMTSSGGAAGRSGGTGSPAATSESEGGCGCRIAARRGNAVAALLLLLGAGAHFARRRR